MTIKPFNVFYGRHRGENCTWSGGSVVVNVSKVFVSNGSPVSPGAKLILYRWASFETEIRRLMRARCLPGQIYGPK